MALQQKTATKHPYFNRDITPYEIIDNIHIIRKGQIEEEPQTQICLRGYDDKEHRNYEQAKFIKE